MTSLTIMFVYNLVSHHFAFKCRHQSRVPLAYVSILPGIHEDHTEKQRVPLVMYGL